MLILRSLALLFFIVIVASCSSLNKDEQTETNNNSTFIYYGADLSYVNEMEDCGATYENLKGEIEDPFKIFKDEGANLIRVRLWNNPTWTNYSNYEDVKKTISRAKSMYMKVMLDFHYSDTWTDPNKQEVPAAWLSIVDNKKILGDSIYNYTKRVLQNLSSDDLLPDIVQGGNEINAMILQQEETVGAMDWNRNSFLINKGIKAVRDVSDKIEVMLHIAQPENALWWFKQALQNGITDYDWIGLSYYPLWSDYTLDNISEAFETLIKTYNKKLMVVETAYPFTMQNIDSANNILDEKALINGFPATQKGQFDYLNTLKQKLDEAGGSGLIYWEPAWVSTNCSTLWGKGSHWDNATLFDHNNKATLGIKFYNGSLK